MELTADKINKMTPPMLRKTVKECGHDPMSEAFQNANVQVMRDWLLDVVAQQDGKKKTKKEKAATPPKTETVPQEGPLPSALPLDVPPQMRAWMEQIELRTATLERAAGLTNGRQVPALQAPELDIPTLLADFLVNGEDGVSYNFSVDDIPQMTVPQKKAVLLEMGWDPSKLPPDNQPREMDRIIKDALDKLDPSDEEEAEEESEDDEEAPAKAAPKPPGGRSAPVAPAGPKFAEGDIVTVTYEGKPYKKCEILEVHAKRGGKSTYTVYFPQDDSNTEVEEADISK